MILSNGVLSRAMQILSCCGVVSCMLKCSNPQVIKILVSFTTCRNAFLNRGLGGVVFGHEAGAPAPWQEGMQVEVYIYLHVRLKNVV
jgi:hypothetical protein